MKETTLIVLLLIIILIGGYFIINDSQQEDEQEKTIVINNTKYVPHHRIHRRPHPLRRLRRNYFYDRLYNDHIYDDDFDDNPSYIYGRLPGGRRRRYRNKPDRLDDSQTSDPVKVDKPLDKSSGNKSRGQKVENTK